MTSRAYPYPKPKNFCIGIQTETCNRNLVTVNKTTSKVVKRRLQPISSELNSTWQKRQMQPEQSYYGN